MGVKVPGNCRIACDVHHTTNNAVHINHPRIQEYKLFTHFSRSVYFPGCFYPNAQDRSFFLDIINSGPMFEGTNVGGT